MLGVMRLTFEREGGSIRGEEDFFSVARTMPFVALEGVRWGWAGWGGGGGRTFDSQSCYTLVDGV